MVAYPKTYLFNAMDTFGESVHTATYDLSISPNDFMQMFIISGVASQFEIGNPKYLLGKSGRELAFNVYEKTHNQPVYCPPVSFDSLSSPEYWAGWILAYYQWFSKRTFKAIQNVFPLEELINKYHPLHEADEQNIVTYIEQYFI